MILGIGIDSVETQRFAQWHTKSYTHLQRIFSEQEIEYSLSNQALSAQRFAVRFAAREAFYKAISAHWPEHTIPFLTLCRAATIIKKRTPNIIVDDTLLQPYGINSTAHIKIHLSLTHTQQIATAFIILETL
jgi:holo-[acyl-carrier protein] synthase